MKKKEMKKKNCLYLTKAFEAAQHEREVERVESFYTELSQTERQYTSPLLLDSVVPPIVEPPCSCTDIAAAQCKQQLQGAQREGDNALLLARQYGCQTQKKKIEA